MIRYLIMDVDGTLTDGKIYMGDSIEIHNMQTGEKQSLLTEEYVELMTSPFDLAQYKDTIMQAMYKGTKREVESEDGGSKNTQVG